jgi:hypothetical protein
MPCSDSKPPLKVNKLHAGLVYKAMGFPTQYFTVLFAVPRVAGYLAHWRESLADPDTKIIRPQQDYKVGSPYPAGTLPNEYYDDCLKKPHDPDFKAPAGLQGGELLTCWHTAECKSWKK